MIIKNENIPNEFDLINNLVFDEMNKDISTNDFVIENLNEYLEYLNERYLRREAANRPEWLIEYIDSSGDDTVW